MDLGWLVHGFTTHRLITGPGIPTLAVWQRRLTTCSDGRSRMIQNYRAYRSAQFLNTDHRLVVTTLKLQLKSRKMEPSQPKLDVGKLKKERAAEEFANKLSGDLACLGALGNPEKLWSAFKTTILDVAGGSFGTHRRAKKNFVSQATLDIIDQSHRAFQGGDA